MNSGLDIASPANAFSLLNARLLAAASQLAYSPGPFTSSTPMPRIVQCAATGTQAFVVEYDDAIIIAFRGTTDVRDWLTNAEFWRTRLTFGSSAMEIHAGFLIGIESVNWELRDAVIGKNKPIYITGHSLGGALAQLCALRFLQSGQSVKGVYTYAQPRVGNAAFRSFYNAWLGFITWRFCAAGDLVPLLPGIFTPPFDGYRHAGHEVFLSNGIHINLPRKTEIALDAWRAWRAICRGDLDFLLQFHSIMGNYLAELNRCSVYTKP